MLLIEGFEARKETDRFADLRLLEYQRFKTKSQFGFKKESRFFKSALQSTLNSFLVCQIQLSFVI